MENRNETRKKFECVDLCEGEKGYSVMVQIVEWKFSEKRGESNENMRKQLGNIEILKENR